MSINYFVSFNDFMYMHPELNALTQEMKEAQYQHYENRRKERIDQVKQKRIELSQSNKSKMSKSKSKSMTHIHGEYIATVIQEEREKLNLLRKHK